MKIINLVAVLVCCSSIVSAETTIEMLKQKAEAGDATAQTFNGMAYHYGYGVAIDQEVAQTWFSKAAAQGDAFAAKQRDAAANLRSMSPEKIKKKIEQAASVPYAGEVVFDDLVSNRDDYTGKVIQINFTAIPVTEGASYGTQYMYIREPTSDADALTDKLYLCGEGALNWQLEINKKSYTASSTVYALVEKDGLIAVGSHHRESDGGHEYKW